MYVRTVDGQETTFGTSGALWRDALVMYDRSTESWWSQVNATAIAGERQGDVLTELPSVVTTWGAWKKRHPQTLVLEKPSLTGSPYDRYFASADALGATGVGSSDKRLPGKELVIGVRAGGATAAVTVAALQSRGFMEANVGGVPVVWLALGAEGAAAFDRRLGDAQVHLRQGEDGLFRAQGSVFDTGTGRFSGGALDGKRLDRLSALRVYWFAWTSFHPGTALVESRP